jgi:hypothetical protein
MSVTVNQSTTPAFTQVGPFRRNSTPTSLPTRSTNGISGTWNPSVISTATVGTRTYTFTPSAGSCATATTMTITVNESTTPTCRNSRGKSVPTNNNQSGTDRLWTNNKLVNDSISKLNLNINSTSLSIETACESYNWNGITYTESGTYTFKTKNILGSDSIATLILEINKPIKPVFTPVGSLCQNEMEKVLLTMSNNGIKGTWNLSSTSTAPSESSTYIFIPNAGQCALSTTMSIKVNSIPNVSLSAFNSICENTGIINLNGGTPVGGAYSGPSIINNAFNTSIEIGSYPITYTYTNSNGCTSSATKNLLVTSCSSSSIVELNEGDIVLYPNPTSDMFTVETSEDLNGKVYLVQDVSGRVLLTGILNMNNTTIEVLDFSTGTYYFKILETNRTLKFIKK